MRVLTAHQYYEMLHQNFPQAKKRIVIQAMIVLWGGSTEVFIPLLEAALRRGVEVRIVGDIYSKYEAKTAKIAKRGPFLDWARSQALNKQLLALGAQVSYVGTLGLNPFRGRCHSKIIIVDDTVYTFGGVNFSDSHLTYQDLMLEKKDAQLADRLDRVVRSIEADEGPLPDLEAQIDNRSSLLFDGGTPGQSVIYDTACVVLAQAKEAYYVSKMCPSGRLAQLLRHIEYHCYFNRPELEGPPENFAIRFDQLRSRLVNSYKGSKKIHAKYILTKNADGTRHVITGSNNFAHRGIAFGTKEIALHSTDPTLWQSLYNFTQAHIA